MAPPWESDLPPPGLPRESRGAYLAALRRAQDAYLLAAWKAFGAHVVPHLEARALTPKRRQKRPRKRRRGKGRGRARRWPWAAVRRRRRKKPKPPRRQN